MSKDKRTLNAEKPPTVPYLQVKCTTPFLRQLKLDIDAIAFNKGKSTAEFIKDLLVVERDKSPDDKKTYKD